MEQENFSQIKQKIEQTLSEQSGVLFGYIFGSLATGTARKESDVDIAVYLEPGHKDRFFDIRLELMEKLTRAFSAEADVTVLNTASPFLKYVALKEGKLAFERDPEARIDFELKALNEYFDYKPILQMYHDRLRTQV